jgi:hypothetical protein
MLFRTILITLSASILSLVSSAPLPVADASVCLDKRTKSTRLYRRVFGLSGLCQKVTAVDTAVDTDAHTEANKANVATIAATAQKEQRTVADIDTLNSDEQECPICLETLPSDPMVILLVLSNHISRLLLANMNFAILVSINFVEIARKTGRHSSNAPSAIKA